jgi:hypothetical protein
MGCGIGDDGRCASDLSIFRLSNPILGRFTCCEGFFRQISDRPLLHALFHDALSLDVFVPAVFGIEIDLIITFEKSAS